MSSDYDLPVNTVEDVSQRMKMAQNEPKEPVKLPTPDRLSTEDARDTKKIPKLGDTDARAKRKGGSLWD